MFKKQIFNYKRNPKQIMVKFILKLKMTVEVFFKQCFQKLVDYETKIKLEIEESWRYVDTYFYILCIP